jgi:hypothetical protein
MAIDRELYQKYSGRSGDPYARMGASLAQRDANMADGDSSMWGAFRRGRRIAWIIKVLVAAAVGGSILYGLS